MIHHYNDSVEKRLDKHGLLDPPEDRAIADGTIIESDDYRIEYTEDELEDDGGDSEE